MVSFIQIHYHTQMTTINVLFVATGPVSYEMCPRQDYSSCKEMYLDFKEKGIPELYDYVIDNNIPKYFGNDCMEIWVGDLPKKYWKHFTVFEPVLHDLDKYDTRKRIAQTVKEYYPNATKINYTTVDMYILEPTKKLLQMARINDKKASKENGITFRFQRHYKQSFQEFIKDEILPDQPPYDMIWFIGVCNPHYLFDLSNEFRVRFRSVLDDKGYICYMDYVYNIESRKPGILNIDFIDFETRLNKIKESHEMRRINPLELIRIKTGFYQFDRK